MFRQVVAAGTAPPVTLSFQVEVQVAVSEVAQPVPLSIGAYEWQPRVDDVIEWVAHQCLIGVGEEFGVAAHVVGASLIKGMMDDDFASQQTGLGLSYRFDQELVAPDLVPADVP